MAQARLMYQKALRFRLTFEHPDFLKALQEVKPLERFTHFFECAPLRGGEDLSLYAAVFLRRADVPFLAMHYPGLKNLVRLTVILDGHDEALDDDTWAHCQDSWRIFPGFTGVRQRFGMLLNDLRVKHDLAYYTQILDDIINASRQLIVVKDVRGIYLNVNDAFCNFVGLPRERIIGETDSYVWTQDQANPVLSEYRGHDSDVEEIGRASCRERV